MRRFVIVLALVALCSLLMPIPSVQAQQCFDQPGTGYCLDEPFASYWNSNGGLPVFGYPVSTPNTVNGFQVQWTERGRLEAHPENAAPYNILLGRLGAERLAQLGRDTFREGREPGPRAGCLWFEQTGHNVCDQEDGNGFLTYWQSNGLRIPGASPYEQSLALFGLPLTAAQEETASTGAVLITQWFERARFEWHPANPRNSRVLLGLLGNEMQALSPLTSSVVGATISGNMINTVAPIAADAGVSWVRYGFISWAAVEPTPGARNWGAIEGTEADLRTLSALGLTPVVVVFGTPTWAQQRANTACSAIKPEALDSFTAFMRDVVARYSAVPYNIRFWEIWNEPDVDPSLIGPGEGLGCWGNINDPGYGGGYYAEMLKRVYPAIKQTNANAQVVIGGLLLDCDPDFPPPNKDCRSARFLEGILQNGGGAAFDILAFHGYSYWGPVTRDFDLQQPLWAQRGGATLGKLTFVRDTMARYKVYKPVLMTEAALLCRAPAEMCQADFPESLTEYILRSFVRLAANGVLGGTWFTFDGPGWHGSGVLDANQQPRLAFHTMKFVGTLLRNAQYEGPLSNGNLEGYAFRKGNMSYHVYWTNDESTATLSLPGGARTLYNDVGQPTPISESTITIGFEPVVIELAN